MDISKLELKFMFQFDSEIVELSKCLKKKKFFCGNLNYL